MKRRSKRAFTLLELLVCIVIISLVSVLVGTKGHQLLAYHQFRSTSQTFLLDLGRFQILSMAGGFDITCKLTKSSSAYLVEWQAETSLPIEKGSLSYELKGVQRIEIQGKPVRDLEFTVFSSGRIDPTLCMTFISKKEEKSLSIDLTYPFYLKEGTIKITSLSPPIYPVSRKDILDK